MAFSCGFYDAIDNDRVYSATQFGEMFDGLITDGVYATIGHAFAVVPGSGVQVKVRSGRAWFNKTWSVNTADLPLDLELPDLLLPRIDAVILEVDTRVAVRNNSIKVITGSPNVNPTKPTLVRSEGLYQYPLAWVTVDQNVSVITTTKIENNIGISPTPFVTGILESITIDELWNQWEGQFDEWFDDLKAQLSGDVAVNLQSQINTLKDDKVNVSDKAIKSDAVGGTNNTKWMTPLMSQQHFLANKATQEELASGSNVNHWVGPTDLKYVFGASGFKETVFNKAGSFTWTVPESAKGRFAIIYIVGSGGGGGSSGGSNAGTSGSNNNYSGPGGGGGVGGVLVLLTQLTQDTYNGVIGAGGAGASKPTSVTSGSSGSGGGTTSFVSFSVYGGGGGGGGQIATTAATYGLSGDGGAKGSGYFVDASNPNCSILNYISGVRGDINYVINQSGTVVGMVPTSDYKLNGTIIRAGDFYMSNGVIANASRSSTSRTMVPIFSYTYGGKGGNGVRRSSSSSSAMLGIAGEAGSPGMIIIRHF